jgi:environmental stress-induced protein Ves
MTSLAAGKCCLYNQRTPDSTPAAIAVFRLVAPSEYRRMPWKNGGGLTEEIATHPDDAGLDGFDWRVSIAEVARNGPFSRFPGIDRSITLIEGGGMRLTGGDRDIVMRTPFEPYAFGGEVPIDCALIDGPIRDFNAMVRRDRARGTVTAARANATIDPADFRLVFAAIGTHECKIGGEPAIDVAPRHTLIVERTPGTPDLPLAIRPLAAGGVALAVRIECR